MDADGDGGDHLTCDDDDGEGEDNEIGNDGV